MSTTISQEALIREMDVPELLAYIASLVYVEDTTGKIIELVNLAKEQYRQLTGEELTTDTLGLSMATASMIAATELVEEINY